MSSNGWIDIWAPWRRLIEDQAMVNEQVDAVGRA